MKEALLVAMLSLSGWLVLKRSGIIDRVQGCVQIDPAGAHDLIRERGAVVIDVREPDEFAASRIPRARHIPLRHFQRRMNELEEYRDKPIVLNCRSGSRSARACALLRKNGYEAYNLQGGLIGWVRANQKLEG